MSQNDTAAVPYGTVGTRPERRARARPWVSASTRPLVLDLDGALLRTDTLFEGVVALLRVNPLMIFPMLLWLARGRAVLKARIAALAPLDAAALPVDERLVALGEEAAKAGRHVVLATAADDRVARALARRFAFIGRVIASDGRVNLKGAAKAAALRAAFPQGFDYAGDSASDLHVFAAAENIFRPRRRRRGCARACARQADAGAARRAVRFGVWARALRLKQWAKNVSSSRRSHLRAR